MITSYIHKSLSATGYTLPLREKYIHVLHSPDKLNDTIFQQKEGTFGNQLVEKNLSMKGRVFPFLFIIFFFSIVSSLLFIVTVVEELQLVLKLTVRGAGKVSGLTRYFSWKNFGGVGKR